MSMDQIAKAVTRQGAMSAVQLERHIGLGAATVIKQIKVMRCRGMLHISYYKRRPPGGKGPCIPYYKLGDMPDADRLPRLRNRENEYAKRRSMASKPVVITEVRRVQDTSAGMWSGLMA